MLKRGLALSLVLSVGSIVQAGALVELVPSGSTNPFNPCGSFSAGEMVTVSVMLSQTPTGADQYLRMVQLDLANSDPALGSPSAMTWTATVNHFPFVQDSRLSNTYHGDLVIPDLELNTVDQFLLPFDGTAVEVLVFDITMPGASGSYTLDVLNSSDTDVDRGGQIRFGYGLGVTPLTTWRGSELSGGSITFDVVDQALTATTANSDGGNTFVRLRRNIARLTFNTDIAAGAGSIALNGQVEIREMLAGGGFGPDLAISAVDFGFSVENVGGPRVLRIEEIADPGVLEHQKWYAIGNAGAWGAVGSFTTQFFVLKGDANTDGNVNFTDLNFILGFNGISEPVLADDAPANTNGDTTVNFTDLNAALGFNGSGTLPMPSGHPCP